MKGRGPGERCVGECAMRGLARTGWKVSARVGGSASLE